MAKLISHEKDRAVYSFEISWDEFDKELNQVFLKNRNRFRIPGFRKGKAPRKIIEMNYGQGVFYEDAINNLLPGYLEEAGKELNLELIGRPDVDIDEIVKNESIKIKVEQDTMPHPELADYKGMEVERVPVEVKDEDVDRVLEEERNKNSILRSLDRPAENGDTVIIDYSGSVDGVKFEGGTAEKQTLVLGSNSFIPGFEDQIVGHAAGDEFDVNVKFPEDYHAKELEGKDAVFAVKLHEVQLKEVPEIDDDFAQDVSEFDSLEEYKKSIKDKLLKDAEEAAHRQEENKAIEKLAEISKIEAPKSLVDEQVDVEIRNMANQFAQMGIGFDKYLEYSGQTIEQLRGQYEETARRRVVGDLALQALVDANDFQASEEEIEEEMKELANIYSAQDPEDFIKRLKDMKQEDLVADDVRKKKALNLLMKEVVLIDPPKKEENKEAKADEKEDKKEGPEKED